MWLKKGSGKIYVNGKLFSEYFADETHKMQITRPFEIINQATEYDVRCSVKGGGPTGQAGAMVHGISKALVLFDEKLKSTLKTEKGARKMVPSQSSPWQLRRDKEPQNWSRPLHHLPHSRKYCHRLDR